MRWLTNNFLVKLASLALASMLSGYVYIYLNYPINQPIFLPLQIRNLDPQFVLVNMQPDVERVLIRVRGPYRSIKQIQSSSHQATLDCSGITAAGTETMRIRLPEFGDAVITGQEPNFVTAQFDKKATATLGLGIDRRGTPATGFVIASEQLASDTVQISGSEAIVNKVKSAQIEPKTAGVSQDIVTDEAVRLYDASSRLVDANSLTITPATVRYSLKLMPVGDTKPLTIVPEILSLPPDQYFLAGLTANPAYIAVKASLVPRGVFTVRTEAVDLSNAREDFTATVGIVYPFTPPPGSNLPTQCQVQVNVESLAKDAIGARRIKIELTHVDSQLDYVLTPPEVILRAAEFEQASPRELSQVRATLDVGGLKPGEHMLSPQISLPPQIEHVTIIPNIIKLTVIQGGK
jgi:YbbR domain-containing protein